jgi:hypothetical protein
MIVGFDIETSEFGQTLLVIIGTGTLLRRKRQSGGSNSSKTRRRH